MSAMLAVVFMSGVIALLVGSIRAARAIRPLVAIRADDRPVDDEPVTKRVLPGAAWLGIALYGLVLASAGDAAHRLSRRSLGAAAPPRSPRWPAGAGRSTPGSRRRASYASGVRNHRPRS